MKRKWITTILAALLAVSLITGCSAGKTASSTGESSAAAAVSSQSAVSAGQTLAAEEPQSGETAVSSGTQGSGELFSDRDFDTGYSSAVTVTLSDAGSTADGAGVTVEGNTVTVTQAGTYVFTGTLSQGQIVVALADDEKAQLVLDNVSVTCADGAALLLESGDKVFLTTAAGSENRLTATGSLDGDDGVDGAVFSRIDLTLNGAGSLTVTSENGHGIVCKDDLKITSGSWEIQAGKDGLNVNDSIRVAGGEITIYAGSDGMQAEHENTEKGYLYVGGGILDVTAGKAGLKASNSVTVEDGSITLNTVGDGLHSDGDVEITGGSLEIVSQDDGAHADGSLTVSGGSLDVTAHEGLEGYSVTVSGGELRLVCDDDGINAAGGNGASLLISGGTLNIKANGDCLDANGNLLVTGGEITITGPSRQDNGIIDYDGTGSITGGTLIATGISGMQENFDSGSTQGSILYTLNSSYAAGTVVTLSDESGSVIAQMTAQESFQVVLVSAPQIQAGETYTLTVDGDSVEIEMSSLLYGSGFGMGGMMGGQQMGGQPGRPGGRR